MVRTCNQRASAGSVCAPGKIGGVCSVFSYASVTVKYSLVCHLTGTVAAGPNLGTAVLNSWSV